MGKLLLLILFAFVVYLLLKRGKRLQPERVTSAPAAEPMIQCAYCRVHVPLSESLPDSEQGRYCCEEHRRLARK